MFNLSCSINFFLLSSIVEKNRNKSNLNIWRIYLNIYIWMNKNQNNHRILVILAVHTNNITFIHIYQKLKDVCYSFLEEDVEILHFKIILWKKVWKLLWNHFFKHMEWHYTFFTLRRPQLFFFKLWRKIKKNSVMQILFEI